MASLLPKTGMLGTRLAKHLLRRTSYLVSRTRIEEFANMDVSVAVDALMVVPAPTLLEPIDPVTNQHWINSGIPPESNTSAQRDHVKSWWMNEARQDPSIGHKMMFFLHSNFVTDVTVYNSYSAFDYLALFRFYAIDNFKTIALKIITDNLMLKYLNGDVNNETNPNENFAREFLELFTIGKGPQQGPGDYTNYTETDIQEAARLLTGFKKGNRIDDIDPDTGIPRGYGSTTKHDDGDKQFSYAFQDQIITGSSTEEGMFTELSDFTEMIFNQDETARNICRKLYRYFVSRNITTEIETDIIEPLATTMRTNDYNLGITMTQLLNSQHFYDEDDSTSTDEIIGSMIKSPLENVLTCINFFNLQIPSPTTEAEKHYNEFYKSGVKNVMLTFAGMGLFTPDTVAGYPAYFQKPDFHRSWFNSSSIIARYKLPQMLLEGKRILLNGNLGGVQLNMVDWVSDSNNISEASDPYVVVSEMLLYMFPEMPDYERETYFLNVFLDGLPPEDWTYEWQNYLASGDDSEVKIPLGHLVTAIMYAPEYQVF